MATERTNLQRFLRQNRVKWEESFPISDLVSQIEADGYISTYQREELNSISNIVEKRRTFVNYFLEKDDKALVYLFDIVSGLKGYSHLLPQEKEKITSVTSFSSDHVTQNSCRENNEDLAKQINAKDISSLRPSQSLLQRHVVKLVSHEWKKFATHLGVERRVCNGLNKREKTPVSEMCMEMLEKWIEGKGSKPPSWNNLLVAVSQECGKEVAKDLRQALEKQEKCADISLRDCTVGTSTALLDISSQRIGAHWKEVGILLGIESATLTGIEGREHTVSRLCSDMLQLWLSHGNGTGDRDRTWSTVFCAVDNIGTEYTKTIKKEIAKELSST